MLLNLHKSFSFQSEEDTYKVGYVFEKTAKENASARDSDIQLLITFSKNGGNERSHHKSGASQILSQSNEAIEKIIEEKILSN